MSDPTALPCLLAAFAIAAFGVSLLAGEEPLLLEPGRKQLFLDDLIVEQLNGLTRAMHQPKKRGAVLKPYFGTKGGMIQTRSAPMWVPEEGVLKMMYNAYPGGRTPSYTGLAISTDGVNWERPPLPGQKDNHVRVPSLPGVGDKMYNVIYDPDDPDPSRRYKGLQGATGRVAVVSPDCLHWRLLDTPKLVSSDESCLTYDRRKRRFLAFLKTGSKYGRAFNISISDDFVHWSQPRFFFGTDDEDQVLALQAIRERLSDPGLARPMFADPDPAAGWERPAYHRIPTWRAECYNIAVFPYEGLYIALPMIFYPVGIRQPERNNTDGFHYIELAMARDLTHWKRLGDRQPFIGPSRLDHGLVGVFDRLQLVPTSHPVERGDELWFYYIGAKWRVPIYDRYTDGTPRDLNTLSPEQLADYQDGWMAVCLAVLRSDGFISLDAGAETGSLLTKPLKLSGKTLMLNLDAGKDGKAEVEILDGQGQPIQGFTRADSVPVTGDAVRLPVTWRQGADLAGLEGKAVRLKIHLSQAKLYAIWTE